MEGGETRGKKSVFFSPKTEKSSLLKSHLPFHSCSKRLQARLSGVPDILVLLIATFAAVFGIQVRLGEQMAFNFKYY